MQVYFLFLESLGTPEMILIALVALIVFGPRKLPQFGRTIGKYTAEFKRASREFRDTFEREIQMAELEEKQAVSPLPNNADVSNDFNAVENTIGRNLARGAAPEEDSFAVLNENNSVLLPEVRAVSQADFAIQSTQNITETSEEVGEAVEPAPQLRKREWL
ncbi:MAG: twin-arginine translocase TatA/TatE family subunit [Pyrinomonadaceae bacterium]